MTISVVTGGGDGLGAVIVRALIDAGRRVLVVDRDVTTCERHGGRSGDASDGRLELHTADLSSVAEVESLADTLAVRGDVDLLVNNAGAWSPGHQFPDADRWLSTMQPNLLTPMTLTQAVWPSLASHAGAVVNIGSSGGEGDDRYGSLEYGVSKARLRRFTTSLGGRDDVRVMAVVPAWIGLPRAQAEHARLSPDRRRDAGHLNDPCEVAAAVVRLAGSGRPGEVAELWGRPATPVVNANSRQGHSPGGRSTRSGQT